MSSPSAAATPSVESLAGPYIFGSLFNWALFGVLSVQVYVYITSFPKDKLWLKGLVYFIFAIEIVQTSLNGYDIYEWFGKGFGDVAGLADVKLSPIDIPLFAAIVSLVVQLFFCYRIWGINSSYWPACVFIVLIALTQATAALYGAASSFIISSIAAAETNRRIVIVWLTLTSVADVLIAAIMTFLLLRARQAEHRFSSDVLTKIVRLVVETNTVTAAMAIITLAVFLGYPDTGYFYTPSVVVGKLYSNTMLVSLNNRIYLRAAASRKPLQLGSNVPIPPQPPMSMGGHQRYASLGQSSTSSADEATKVQSVVVNMTPSNDMEIKMFRRPAAENAV